MLMVKHTTALFSAAGRLHQQPAAETPLPPKALQPRLCVTQALAFDAPPFGRTVVTLHLGQPERLQFRDVGHAVLQQPRQPAERQRVQAQAAFLRVSRTCELRRIFGGPALGAQPSTDRNLLPFRLCVQWEELPLILRGLAAARHVGVL